MRAIGLSFLLACATTQPSVAQTPAPPSAPSPPPAPTAPAPGTRNDVPLASVYTTDPSALASLLAAAAAAGTAWLGPPAATPDAAEAGLRATAAQSAPGMKAEGQVAKASLSEGGHIAFIANLDATKCYAIVAYGAGATDLDVNLLAPPFYNLLIGQDGMVGPAAVIGGGMKPLCPIIPLAVAYKVDLHAKKGGGAVAAQIYSKPK